VSPGAQRVEAAFNPVPNGSWTSPRLGKEARFVSPSADRVKATFNADRSGGGAWGRSATLPPMYI